MLSALISKKGHDRRSGRLFLAVISPAVFSLLVLFSWGPNSVLLPAFILLAMIAIGLPTHAALYQAGAVRLFAYMPLGVIEGAVIGALITSAIGLSALNETASGDFRLSYLGVLPGAVIGGICAWIGWVIRRPDRDDYFRA